MQIMLSIENEYYANLLRFKKFIGYILGPNIYK